MRIRNRLRFFKRGQKGGLLIRTNTIEKHIDLLNSGNFKHKDYLIPFTYSNEIIRRCEKMKEYEKKIKKLDEQLEQASQDHAEAIFNYTYEEAIENDLSYSEFSRKIVELSRKGNSTRLQRILRKKLSDFENEFKVPIIAKKPPLPAETIEVAPFVDGLYSAIKGLEFTKNEPIRMSISDNERKYEFNFNGLPQEKIFEIADNVVISAAKQLVNLHKGMPYKEALEKIDSMRRSLLFSGLEPYQKQTKVLIIERSKEILEDRMKNLPVK